jgi:aldehyde dehydrogenase (NAD+)
VAFTGSVEVGRRLGAIAAERIIPMTLELGGKSANIVFDDADLEKAATGSVWAFTQNAGQVCSAGTRLLVQAAVHDELIARMRQVLAGVRFGDDLGPVISRGQYDTVQEYLALALDEGATVVTADGHADPVPESGYFVAPTLLVGSTNEMRIAREEIFGPVLAVIPFETEADAVRIANDSDYGLVAGLWSRDISRALRVADQLEAGQVFINSWSPGAVQTPFGGYKASGYGREKGVEALHHYSQLKSVTVAL